MLSINQLLPVLIFNIVIFFTLLFILKRAKRKHKISSRHLDNLQKQSYDDHIR